MAGGCITVCESAPNPPETSWHPVTARPPLGHRWLRAGQTLFLRLRSEKRARQQIGINLHQERAEHSRVSNCSFR